MKYPNVFSKYFYYLSSILTLLYRFDNRSRTISTFLRCLPPVPFEVKIEEGLRFEIRHKMDLWVLKETCFDKVYFNDLIEPQDGWTILDVGSAFGDFALFVGHRFPNSRVFAVEPNQEFFERLEAGIRRNQLDNIRAINVAVGGASNFPAKNQLYPGSIRIKDASYVSLEQLLEAIGGTCDLLKIDCEGAEYSMLLESSARTLSKIRYISMEYHDFGKSSAQDNLVKYLKSQNFKVIETKNPVHSYLGYLYCARV